jgi:solute carrier family 50 protein (sugar transporter)
VSPNNILVSTINGTGSVIEAIYVVIFLIFAVDRRARLRMLGLLSIVASIFTTVVLVSLLALHGNARKVFCGLAATIFSICMYASPLSIMVSNKLNARGRGHQLINKHVLGVCVQRLVIKTKSVEFMPFLLSLAVFLCGTSWFIYGLLGRDPFIIVRRFLSLILSTLTTRMDDGSSSYPLPAVRTCCAPVVLGNDCGTILHR